MPRQYLEKSHDRSGSSITSMHPARFGPGECGMPPKAWLLPLKINAENAVNEAESRKMEVRYHKIEWHRKFSLSMACFVLFFLAPRWFHHPQGRIRNALVVAIIFPHFPPAEYVWRKIREGRHHLSFHRHGWPYCTYTRWRLLTYKAMHDSQLFNKEFYYRLFKACRAPSEDRKRFLILKHNRMETENQPTAESSSPPH